MPMPLLDSTARTMLCLPSVVTSVKQLHLQLKVTPAPNPSSVNPAVSLATPCSAVRVRLCSAKARSAVQHTVSQALHPINAAGHNLSLFQPCPTSTQVHLPGNQQSHLNLNRPCQPQLLRSAAQCLSLPGLRAHQVCLRRGVLRAKPKLA